MQPYNHEKDPDDLRQLDESVERVYWELPDSEEILSILSRIDHGEEIRYISDHDEPLLVENNHIDKSLSSSAIILGSIAIWSGGLSKTLDVSGYDGLSDVLDGIAVSSGLLCGIALGTWGMRRAILRYRRIDNS